MSNLEKYDAHICLTVSSVLIHDEKVLLIKHKKLGMWLNPGGHIEANEMPHQAAEREFFEETSIKVKAIDWQKLHADDNSEYLPHPILTNLHWVSKINYDARIADPEHYELQKQWTRGCEQHLNFVYLVEPVDSIKFTQNLDETDGIEWFELAKLDEYDLRPNIKTELEEAWRIYKKYVKNAQ